MNSFRRVLQQLRTSSLGCTGSSPRQKQTGFWPFLQRTGLGFCFSLCLAGLLFGGPAATLSYGQAPATNSEVNSHSPTSPPPQAPAPNTELIPGPTTEPTTTQQATEQAAVMVNGTTVFEVSGDLARSAVERAQLIQLQLDVAIEDSNQLVVTVGDRNGTPALLLNKTLLTLVTSADIADNLPSNRPPNQASSNDTGNSNRDNSIRLTPQQQAEVWARSLQSQLDQLPPTQSEITTPLATTNPARAARVPVEINSRRLFRVAKIGGESAERRAAEISSKLESLDPIKSVSPVEIREEAGLPTLWLQQNDRDIYLLTITQADATPASPAQMAKTWAKAIDTGIRETRKELKEGIQERLVSALGVIGIALMLQWGLIRLWTLTRQRLEILLGTPQADDEEHPYRLLNFSLRILLMLMLTSLWVSALLYIANFFPITRELSNTLRDYLINTLTAPIIPIGDGYSLASFVLLGGVLTAMLIASSALTDFLRSRFLDALGIGMGLQEAISVVFKYSFITLSFIILLQLWGIDLSSLAILASALGVGIGFGLQDIAKNLGSGLVLVFERPIQVGDFVEVGGYIGTIEKLGARSTRLRTMDDLTVFVPNSRFLQEEVTNWSHKRTPSRIKIPVGVAYGSDLEVVKDALLEVAQAQKAILKAPKPQVFFMGFGDSSLDLVLLVWISRPQLKTRLRSELNFKIDAAFRQHHIEIPFPQRDLHMHPSSLPMPLTNTANPPNSDSPSEPSHGKDAH